MNNIFRKFKYLFNNNIYTEILKPGSKFDCRLCKKKLTNMERMREHLETEHEKTGPDDELLAHVSLPVHLVSLSCQICDFSVFCETKSIARLTQAHRDQHSERANMLNGFVLQCRVCPYCTTGMISARVMDEHLNIHNVGFS